MIGTLSLCPVCYKKLTARIVFRNGMAVMEKTCDVHGDFSAIMDTAQHVSNFYRRGTKGLNNNIIIHIADTCNMTCKWCYYESGHERMQDMAYYDNLLSIYKSQGFRLMLSGGEPTERPDYFQFLEDAKRMGWHCGTITNMINLADEQFFNEAVKHNFSSNLFDYALSFQHPVNYSAKILAKKIAVMDRMKRMKIQAQCCAFSIQSLDELDFIKEFYDQYKDTFFMLRIRTMFRNWGNKDDDSERIMLSELNRAFMEKFANETPHISEAIETSNIYCMYLQTGDGRHISLSSSPTVENLDYHICSRPVYMLGLDGRCYPVAISQIVSEGISKGWKDGFRIEGGKPCLA